MWHFAIGLYLVELTPGSLRLTAIYQLVSTLSIIIFGPLVGDWVDANPRLKGTCSCLLVITLVTIQQLYTAANKKAEKGWFMFIWG